jgi:aminopeptidase N
LLSSRFGVPKADYFGIVEARSMSGNGWRFASNQVVVAAGWPRILSTKDGMPRAFLGHEIGHMWTAGSGPAGNFLREGWATYVESVVVELEFGAETAKEFWKKEAESYFADYDGKANILDDENNGGISYSKGAWIFHMLNEVVGDEAFDRAMTKYSSESLAGGAGWEILAECFQDQRIPYFDARAFLTPWLKGKSAPGLSTETRGNDVLLHQSQPFFLLPVTIEATTSKGIERHMAWVREVETVFTFDGAASNPRIDPDGQLLLRH